MIVPQFEMFTATGAMKSLSSAVKDEDERLFTNALPNASHTPGGKTPAAVRSIAASPKSPAPRLPPAIGSAIVPVFTAPSETVPASVTCLPQQGSALALKHWLAVLPAPAVSQVFRPNVGVPEPPKS